MSGRDHETDHDGECIPDCRECRIESLEDEVENLKYANKELLEKVRDRDIRISNLEIDLACEMDGEGY